ncbi:MAG: hypothetical protein IGQ45_02215 [Cyanobacterium sp. T60_A2020_053]|nr:hypothetical protein [Cyanobacterium sp. T60_A2020_053]
MTTKIEKTIKIQRPSLARYREMMAHVRQVNGVSASLLPQTDPNFDYLQSQVGGIMVEYNSALPPTEIQQLEAIINYYQQLN